MTDVVVADGLGKRYGSTWALRGCSLAIPDRSVVALVGPNGAGKTTLLQLAVGLLAPTCGRIAIWGEPPRQQPRMLDQVGFVAQGAPLYPSFRVDEMLSFGQHLNSAWDDAWARERLGILGIPLRRRVGSLSGGERAQVALVLALAKRPRLLLLDEPVASLDPLARRSFLQTLMEAVTEHEVTVVMSSHLITDLERVCDFLVLVMAAEVRLAASIDELLGAHRVLTGPRHTARHLPGVAEVIRSDHTDRQSTSIVRLAAPIESPQCRVDPIGLEELLLAYMSARTAPAGVPVEPAGPFHRPRIEAL